MVLEVSESGGHVLRLKKQIEVFGEATYAGVLLQGEGAGYRVLKTMLVESDENFAIEICGLRGKRNLRGRGQ